MNKFLKYSALLFASWLFSCTKTDAQEIKHVSAKEAHDLIAADTGIFLLDVRSAGEFKSETGHLRGAHLIPVDELESRIAEIPPSKKVLAYCRSGSRSTHAAKILSKKGISAMTMDGGIIEWRNEGFDVERSAK